MLCFMIVHRDGKWLLLTRDGKKVLGEHGTREAALAQERAILASQARRAAKACLELATAIKRRCKPRGKDKPKG